MSINLKFDAKFNHLIFLIFTLLTSYSFAQKCGCGSTGANLCSPQYYTTKAAAEADAATGTPAATIDLSALNLKTDAGQTHQLCYEYTTKATETNIGFRFYVGTPQNCSETRVISISPSCGGTSLTPTTTTSAGFNEYTVNPSTKYNICVTLTFDPNDSDCDEVDITKPAEIQYVELYVYNADASSSCNASIGTVALTNLTGTGNELSVNLGDTWTIKHNNFVLPPAGNGGSFMGYLLYTCKPPSTIDITNPANGVAAGCFKGVTKTATDQNINGSSKAFSGLTELWLVPVTFDTDESLADGKDRIDEDLDGCYDIGQAIHITYLSGTTPACATCATATCKVTSITAPTLAKGRTDITTALASAGDQYGGLLLVPDESATICVPVKVPQGSTALGFKMKTTASPGGCGNTAEQIVSYELKPVGCGTKINPTRTNAQPVLSGFNPEWDNIAPGDYILCFTMKADPMMFCSTIEINGLGYYNVGAVCPADNGTQAVKINNATPPATKAYATNSYGICYDDVFTIETNGAIPNVDYAAYIGAPSSNDPSTETSKYTAFYAETFNKLTETSKGNTSAIIDFLNTHSFAPTKNTVWWVPISTATVGGYNPACFQMDYQNESYKVTYLNDIKITATETCASSKVSLKFEGGGPEFITGKKYNITTNKGSLSAASVSSSGGTIDLTGLSQNDNYVINVTDEIGCTKSYSGTYTCACTQPNITAITTICEGTTVEWISTAPLTSSDNTFVTIASTGANKYNITALKPTTSSTNLKLTATSGTCSEVRNVTINPKLATTIKCGTPTSTSVKVEWTSVTPATGYSIEVNKGSGYGTAIPVGISPLSYDVTGLSASDVVKFKITPTGPTGSCYVISNEVSCSPANCPKPTLDNNFPVDATVCADLNATASFKVIATSTPEPTYKWQKIVGTNPAVDLQNDAVFDGVDKNILNIKNITGLDGVKFQCVATETSGTGCNITSFAKTLKINPLPTFIPTALDICEGETPVITYPSLTGTPDKIIFDPGITGVTPINLPLTASPFKITGLTLPVNTYSGVKVKLENSTTGCKSTDITIPAFKVLSTQKPSISSKSTSINSVIFQWPDLIGLNTQTGTEDKYTVKEFVCTGCTTPGTYVPGTGTLSYNGSTSKWEYLRNVTNPGDKVFIEVTPVDVAPLATPSCYAASTYDLLAITCTSPIITKDIIDVSLCEGTSATPIPASFELEYNTADATTPVTWEILKPGATWAILNPTGVYTITATSTYIDNKLSISDIKGLDGTKYRANIKTATPGGSCNTISYEALLTVKPLPTITPITDKSFCPGTIVNDPLKTTKDIEFKVSQYGTPTFSWVSDVQTTGVSSGQSNVNSFASFTTLSPSSEASSKITVTPTLNGCVGSPIDFKVIVKPKIKPIFSTPSASDITYSSVKFNWNSSLPTITPDEWKVDTISVLENASDPLPTSYFSVSPNRTSAQNFYTYNVKSGKKAFIIVTPISTGSTLFCADTARKYLIPIACVTPTKPLTPVANPVCEGSALDLTGVLTDATADFQWKISTDGGTVWNNVSGTDFGSTGTTNVLSTSTTKSYMNNALVKLVLTDKISGQCTVESDKVTLAINPLPTVNLIQPSKLSLCVDDPEVAATVQPLIGKTPMKIDYTLNSVTSSNQDIANLEIKFSTKEDKIHSLTIDKVIDANGCESLLTGISSSVTINKNPTPDFIVSDTIGCIPLNVVFTDNSGIVYKDVTWDFGTGSNSSKDKGSSNYSFQKAGDFTITYSVEDNQGCKAQIIKTDKIHAKNTPIASISTDRNIVNIYENEVRFDSKLSQNASFYIWDFGDNSPISNDPVVKHKYDPTMPGKYKVSLIVSNSATNMSCSDTAVTWIDFPEEVIYYIPNTFTPNGDEFNNTFQPIFSSGYDPQNYSFIVFDRWGQIVFESNNPTVGWDGTFGDQVLGNDTFVWKLGFKEKANDNEHYSTGHVNLVK